MRLLMVIVAVLAFAQLAPAQEVQSADRKFIDEAMRGGMAEVKLGRLACAKGSSTEVRAFGQRMIDDHSRADEDLRIIADQKNLPVPMEIDKHSQAIYDKLSKLSGDSFDKAYVEAMVSDHDEDVKAFKNAVNTSKLDADLRGWAQKTLVVVESHDHQAHEDKAALGKQR